MKTTTVPAQVTTVEDRIAGSLTLSQLLLLIAPLFIGSAIYLIFPPALHLTPLKFIISFLVLAVAALSAIRIKGKLVLFWAVVLIRYAIRPRYHVFNKNDLYLRRIIEDSDLDKEPIADPEPSEAKPALALELTPLQLVRAEGVLADPRSKLHFRIHRKGDLRVHVTEVK
ncbi:MAG TPA: hypothetical protein VMR34_03625 [Candidatus Saccharimonadales bacterium]|nr:hypothetical protein [Candidatus Saccharimonadales bacterium]